MSDDYACNHRININKYEDGLRKYPLYPLPTWVYESVVYEIFPDRFQVGIELNKKIKFYKDGTLKNWNEIPDATGDRRQGKIFFGGDLIGVLNRLDYIEELGANTIYLTPIFKSPSNHKYDTVDYFKIDPQFGGNSSLKKLLQKLKSKGMRLILDGVFNHVSSEHPWFKKAVKGNRNFISKFSFSNDGHRGWWGIRSLPELNLEENLVREHITNVITYYLKLGIHGWRLDCGQDLGPVNNAYITSVVKAFSEDKYVVSELWTYPNRWNMVDGVMNYHFRELTVNYLLNVLTDLGLKLEKMYRESPNIYGSWNMLDSHDTERLANTIPDKLLRKLAIILQFTFPGVPVIYYGTEIGMEGGKDPDCRRPMVWDISKWDTELFEFYKSIIRLRKTETALKIGTFELLNNEPLVFLRKCPYQLDNLIVAINKGKEKSIAVPINDGRILDRTVFVDLFTKEKFKVISGTLKFTIREKGYRILKPLNEIVNGYNQYKRIF
ncbi:MAG: cyclomaltodextrinase [Fervidobacterium sp.]